MGAGQGRQNFLRRPGTVQIRMYSQILAQSDGGTRCGQSRVDGVAAGGGGEDDFGCGGEGCEGIAGTYCQIGWAGSDISFP